MLRIFWTIRSWVRKENWWSFSCVPNMLYIFSLLYSWTPSCEIYHSLPILTQDSKWFAELKGQAAAGGRTSICIQVIWLPLLEPRWGSEQCSQRKFRGHYPLSRAIMPSLSWGAPVSMQISGNLSCLSSGSVRMGDWVGRTGYFFRVLKSEFWSHLDQTTVVEVVKNLPAVQEIWVRSLGREDTLEDGMATHSSILAWRIPWTEEPGGQQSMGSQRIGHNWTTNTFMSSTVRKEQAWSSCSELIPCLWKVCANTFESEWGNSTHGHEYFSRKQMRHDGVWKGRSGGWRGLSTLLKGQALPSGPVSVACDLGDIPWWL